MRMTLTYQLILIGRHSNEYRLGEDKSTELLGRQGMYRAGVFLPYDVDTRLVFVHRIENDLQRDEV